MKAREEGLMQEEGAMNLMGQMKDTMKGRSDKK
jgi:hypothetical protein